MSGKTVTGTVGTTVQVPRTESAAQFSGRSAGDDSLPQSLPWRSVPAGTGCDACGQALLPCSTFHYSISHSGEWVVCAVGAVPLGVDIQVERPVRPVVFRALSPVEQRELDGLEEQECFPAFFDVWCLKEAYSKAIGLGLKSRFRDFSVSKKAEISVPCFSVALPRFGDCRYHLGICAQTVPMPRLQLQVVEKRELL